MSTPGTRPEHAESRKFDIATEVGTIKGLLEGLFDFYRAGQEESINQIDLTLEAVQNIHIPSIMAAKNTQLFLGELMKV